MLNYIKRLNEALVRSEKYGFTIPNDLFPFEPTFTRDIKQKIFQHSADVLYDLGYQNSSLLAGKCAPVHMAIQYSLRKELNINSYITIGDRYWNDYIYCEMTDENIEKEIKQPNHLNPIKAHVWLTFTDGSILDCTSEAHLDIIQNRGEHPAHECIHFEDVKDIEDPVEGYYRPILLGQDFLIKTGMVQLPS